MTPMFARFYEALDKRLGVRAPGRKIANKVFPHNWSFLIGEITLFSLIILVLTGVFLTMFFRGSTLPTTYAGSSELYRGQELPAAFESIVRLSHDVPGGLLFRRIHRGASHLFIASMILHLLRILLTGAFRRPREFNYLVGLGLLALALAEGFTGYSLPYDSLAGTGIRIAYSEMLAFPFVGDRLAFWVFGGEFPGAADVIPRFFVFHVLLLPGLIIGLVTLHLVLVVRQRHTQFPRPGLDGHRLVVGKPLWPSQFAESLTLLLWTGGLLTLAAVLIPWSDVDALGPYLPAEVGNNAQPDWFLFWVDGMLRVFPALEFEALGVVIAGTFVAGAVLPGFVFIGLALYPWIERKVYGLRGDWHVLQNPLEIPLRAGVVLGTFSFILIVSAAATNDIISRITGIRIEVITAFFQVTSVVVPLVLGFGIAWYSRRRLARTGRTVARSEEEANSRFLGVGSRS